MNLYSWQEAAWAQLHREAARMPHALLLHGPAGIGKFAFAKALSQSLLCENVTEGRYACGTCSACGWFTQGNHPDFRLLAPAALRDQYGVTVEAGEGDEPESPADDTEVATPCEGKPSKALSKEIRIDDARALSSLMNITTHRGGRRVVLIVPAETLNLAAANALLKLLEEPPPASYFILVTHQLQRLLPTIRSRARLVPLVKPSHEVALAWLRTQKVSDAAGDLARAGGRPLAAFALAEEGSGPAVATLTLALVAASARNGKLDPLQLAESLAKLIDSKAAAKASSKAKTGNAKPETIADLLQTLARWTTDQLFTAQVGADGSIRYHPSEARTFTRQTHTPAQIQALHRFARKLQQRMRHASHPLNARLFLEDVLFDYVALGR